MLAGNYRAAMLTDVGEASYRDQYVEGEFHLDVSVAKAVSERLTVSAQVNGLTAREERESLGRPGTAGARLQQWERYGPYGTLHLRYSFR